MNTLNKNLERITSYTVLAKEPMEANWIFLGYRGVVQRNGFPIESPQAFYTVLKLVGLAIFHLLVKFQFSNKRSPHGEQACLRTYFFLLT